MVELPAWVVLVGGLAAGSGFVSFLTVRARNRYTAARAHKVGAEAQSTVIVDLRAELERVKERLAVVERQLKECEAGRKRLSSKLTELEMVVNGHHSASKRGTGRTS